MAQRDAKSKTAFVRMVLMFFVYKKEELKAKRLHELDQDIVHTIAGWYLYIFVLLKMVFKISHLKKLSDNYCFDETNLYQLVSI